eukprot:9604263-Karenia_brevis.AAC.1
MKVDKNIDDEYRNLLPSVLGSETKEERVTSPNVMVEEVATRHGEGLQESVLGQCSKIEKRMNDIDER